MPGDRVVVASLPDQSSAKMISDMLRDNGIADATVRGVPGVAYVPQASALDWIVSVEEQDAERARLLLADFEAESAQAAIRQAADLPGTEHVDEVEAPVPRRKWVFWVALAGVALFAIPFLLNVLLQLRHFIVELFF